MIKAGDIVTLKDQKTRSVVVRVFPMQHWPGCVEIDPPLGGYKYHDVSDLEISKSKQPLK